MIIVDTNILFKGPDSTTADLLKTIRMSGVDRVGVPWVVLEELTAQRAVPYREKYEAATQALESLKAGTPWKVNTSLPPMGLRRFQDHWREKFLEVVEVIPTSEAALREAMIREANVLPPCKKVAITENGDREEKIGGRDAAIWLTAVEYAREHPGEKVYLVSRNTKDFGNGTAFPYPMNEDLEGIEDRFVLLTKWFDVMGLFSEETDADEDAVREILAAPAAADLIAEEAVRTMSPILSRFRPMLPRLFECTLAPIEYMQASPLSNSSQAGASSNETAPTVTAAGWVVPPEVRFDSVRELEARRIGDHVWCAATARWLLTGHAVLSGHPSAGFIRAVGCAWETRVLVSTTQPEAELTVLRSLDPQPITASELETLPAPRPLTEADTAALGGPANRHVRNWMAHLRQPELPLDTSDWRSSALLQTLQHLIESQHWENEQD